MGSELQRSGVDVNQTRAAHQDLQNIEAKYLDMATDTALAAGGALPPPWGTAADVASLGRSLSRRDWGGALFDVVGFVPILGDGIKGGRVAVRLNRIRRSIDVARDAVQRNLRSTREAAERYWNNVARRNRQAYDDAIKNCRTKACRDGKATMKGPQYANTPVDGPNGSWVGERGDSVWKPSNGGPAINYRNGFPDYSPHSQANVDIPMRGNHSSDFTAARNEMRNRTGNADWELPSDMTWHHHQNGTTMQLVPKNVHGTGGGASSSHSGGASMYGNGSHASEF